MRLVCTTRGRDGTRLAGLRFRPGACSVRRLSPARSPLVSLTKATWRNWGRAEAFARATLASPAEGSSRRVTVKAFRPRPDCTGRYRVYTRMQITAGRRTTTYKLTACATSRR